MKATDWFLLPGDFINVDGALKAPLEAELPPICIKTGARADLVKVRQRLYWNPLWIAVFVIIALLVYIILALVTQRKTTVTYYMSRAAKASHLKWHMANWAVFLSSILCLILARATDVSLFVVGFPILIITSIVIYFRKVRIIYAKNIDTYSVTIGGISRAVVNEITKS